jgi:uncharacterized protein (DUF1330 family)
MSVYFAAVMKVHDREKFLAYRAGTFAALQSAGVDFEPLALTNAVTEYESDSAADEFVLLKFPDDAEFRKWWDSADYDAVRPLRVASAEVVAALTAEGL